MNPRCVYTAINDRSPTHPPPVVHIAKPDHTIESLDKTAQLISDRISDIQRLAQRHSVITSVTVSVTFNDSLNDGQTDTV